MSLMRSFCVSTSFLLVSTLGACASVSDRDIPIDDIAACGGSYGDTCLDDEYCHIDSGCDLDSAAGECRLIPDVCIAEYNPVCGCDGFTYENACLAAADGVSIAYYSPCDE